MSEVERIGRERDLYRRLLGLGDADEIEPFLRRAVELAVDLSGAEQCYLELRDPAGADYEPAWTFSAGCSTPELADIRLRISRGIIAEAISTGETISTNSALLDARFRERESVHKQKIQAVLCAPIGGNAALGVVYLQGRVAPGHFDEATQELAEIFAGNLARLADRILAQQRAESSNDAMADLRGRYELDAIVGRSRALAYAVEQAMLAAPLDVTVLLTGASGTGKSQLARAIHRNSTRSDGPFIDVNCAALPENLVESELFGSRAGSHSSARSDMPGKVAAAEGGTLFLNEVGELPFESQAKLLQLLHEKEYYPLGASQAVDADVRVVAATNADLERLVEEKNFRSDLYYRLNVLPVRLPSLAERRDDLKELTHALCDRAARKYELSSLGLSLSALSAVQSAEWPGNVRQLENHLEAAVIRASGQGAAEVEPRHLFPDPADLEEPDATETFQEATRRFQRDLIERALDEADWNVSEAARRLEVARSYLYQLIQSFGLSRNRN
jgi:Nif-specific regulatory protein